MAQAGGGGSAGERSEPAEPGDAGCQCAPASDSLVDLGKGRPSPSRAGWARRSCCRCRLGATGPWARAGCSWGRVVASGVVGRRH